MANSASTVSEGALLWTPSDRIRRESNIAAFMRWLELKGLAFSSYDALWNWSVRDLESFWQCVWEYFGIQSSAPYQKVLSSKTMPGTRWFEGAELNYAEHALRRQDDHTAVIYRAEDGRTSRYTYAQLADQVARARAGLRRLGVRKGDRVAAFMPNAPETLVAFLACASLGATWSSCSPEFGVGSVLDRFTQIEPKILFAVDAYSYNGKQFDRLDAVREIASKLPTLQKTILLSRSGRVVQAPQLDFVEFTSTHEPLVFDPVPFDHPLWILYSSGTTGLPKPIVQGHGGILLEHAKTLSLHCDIKGDDRFFWFTTTGWMMWNFLISGLVIGCTVMLYEGSPGHPDLMTLFRFAAEEGMTYFGTSAPYLLACRKAGIAPKGEVDLTRLRALGSTGAPLPVEGFTWVYENVSDDILLGSVSGGTDVCTAFIASCPLLPVHAGELQCRALGAKVEAYGDDANPVLGEVGELVITEPMPSMPLYFLNDPDGKRLHASYFDQYPGVWRHGDWLKITERGTCVIYGRSDSTLNRGGVRMGTSEFYRVVEDLPQVADALVVDTSSLSDEGKLWLFVVPAAETVLDDAARKTIRDTLRTKVSPRHVPDEIVEIREVPRTINGKKLEVPIKRILQGVAFEKAVNVDTLANPAAIQDVLAAAMRK